MAIHDSTTRNNTVESSSSADKPHSPCNASTTSYSAMASVAKELEQLRCLPPSQDGVQFPPACHSLLLSLPGNRQCADCGAPRPEWASISYGILLCVQCCGRHRSFGVWHSRVKSLEMDAWNHRQVLAMLEGGNEQLRGFFDRHEMSDSSMLSRRYKTKAALFYRTHLSKHVEQVGSGMYQGREAARRQSVKASNNPQPMEQATIPSQEIAAN